MIITKELDHDLWRKEKSICFFVHQGKCHWVLDYQYNFDLNVEKDYEAYLEKGHITQEQFTLACEEFRGGILNLDETNFLDYLQTETVQICTVQELKKLVEHGNHENNIKLLDRVEKLYLNGEKLNSDEFKSANELAARLPLFYINFDIKTYLHMNWQRLHEELAYPDWYAKAKDFNYLIPDHERYWVHNNRDYWKTRYLHD